MATTTNTDEVGRLTGWLCAICKATALIADHHPRTRRAVAAATCSVIGHGATRSLRLKQVWALRPHVGMLSDQAMTALQNAHGVDASRQFLTEMIQHHQGAIAMGPWP